MANHDLSKIVDAAGEVFDLRDASAVHTVDSALSSSSTNPVQNKVVKAAVDLKADKVSNATANNLAGLDANGNLKDSGGSWKNMPVPSTYVGTAGYVEFGRIVCETQMNHPVVFEVFSRARSMVRLEVLLVSSSNSKPYIDWTRLTYSKNTQNIEVGYSYEDSSAESDGKRTFHFWIKVYNYDRVGTRVSVRHDYISGGIVSAQNTYSETEPTGYTIIQANDSLDDKVSKSGDTMTGRLTMDKAVSQLLIGTGTAARSSTSGSTITYFPALWKYNLGEANPTPGDRLVIKTPVAGSDWGTFISTDNGTTYYPVARHTGANRLTTQYPAGAYICVVFEEYVNGSSAAGQVNDIFPVAGATARTSLKIGCWRVINDYDSGNTVSQLRTENGRFRTGSTGVNPYTLVCLDKNGTFSMLTSSGSGTGTSKTINTSGKFKLDAVIFWYNGTATGANTLAASTYNTFSVYHAVDTRYSHNHTTTFTTNAPLYIECTIDEDGFWSPTTKCITQTLESGKYYIFLGMTYSTEYQLSLMADHPLYYYDGTNLTQVPRLAKADRTKLDGIASGATKVEASSTNGKIKINGTDTTVYTHPTTTAVAAAAVKVGKDSSGHVVLGDALSKSDVGLGNVANTNITVSATNGVKDVTNNVTYKYTHPTSGANTSKGDTTAQTPDFGSTFKVLSATVDSMGHTTALADHTVTIPSALADGNEPNAGGRNGLMSREDKAKLNSITAGATNNGGNFKAVSAEASQGLTNTEKENARTNIGAQADLKIQLVEYGTAQYSDITAILSAGKIPAVVYSNALYICDGTVWTVNSVNEYRFTYASGNIDSPRIIFLKLRDSSAGWGSGVVTLVSTSSMTTGLAGKEDRIATAFTSSTDYNDLIAHGLYEVTNSPASGTRHSPEAGRIPLWVNKVTDSNGYYVTQLAIGDDAYIRRTYNQGAAWMNWTYIVESSNCKRILLDNAIGSEAGTLYII